MQEHRESLAPFLVQLLQIAGRECPAGSAQQASGPVTQGIAASVLFKEAVYAAIGVGAYELHDYIELSSWLRSSLLLVSLETLEAAESHLMQWI